MAGSTTSATRCTGAPGFRLLRREVEDLVSALHGHRHLNDVKARAELTRVNRELKRIRTQLSALEDRRTKLIAHFGD